MALKKAFDGEVFYWYDDGKNGDETTPVNATTTTTPPSLTEQARQLVDEMYREGCDWHGPTVQATCDHFHRGRLIERIVSFAAEVATRGQVVGIERAVEILDAGQLLALPEAPETAKILQTAADAIRALSLDPSYLNRVRNEAATAALEQAAQKMKKLNRYILTDQVDDCDIVRDDDGNYLLYEDVIAAIGDDKEQQQ